jgi:lysophospholipase L1-like esterase
LHYRSSRRHKTLSQADPANPQALGHRTGRDRDDETSFSYLVYLEPQPTNIESQRMPSVIYSRKFLYTGMLLVGFVIASLVLLELGVRIFDIGPKINPVWSGNYRLSENPVLGYELAPGSLDVDSRINSHGMRDKEYGVEKPPNTFRIAVIGDSIALGFGVREIFTFSNQLEEILNRSFRTTNGVQFEVLNFGVTGYGFEQSAEMLRSRAIVFDPDVVIYAYTLNDPQEYSLEMGNLMALLTDAEKRFLLLDGPKNLAQSSRLYRFVRYLLTRADSKVGEVPVMERDDPQFRAHHEGKFADYYAQLNTANETWRPVAAGLDKLNAFTTSRGVRLHVAVFPLLTDLVDYPIPNVHRHLAHAFADQSIPHVDLLDFFVCHTKLNQTELGVDELHPNGIGHGLAAVAILRHLLTTGSLPGVFAQDFSGLLRGTSRLATYAKATLDVEAARQGHKTQCPSP